MFVCSIILTSVSCPGVMSPPRMNNFIFLSFARCCIVWLRQRWGEKRPREMRQRATETVGCSRLPRCCRRWTRRPVWFSFELGTKRFTGKLNADGQKCKSYPGPYVLLPNVLGLKANAAARMIYVYDSSIGRVARWSCPRRLRDPLAYGFLGYPSDAHLRS